MEKTRITVLGVTGMLGHKVYETLSADPDFIVTGTSRGITEECFRIFDATNTSDKSTDTLVDIVLNSDYIINCIGVIKPKVAGRELDTIMANSRFPWFVSAICELQKSYGYAPPKFINITTDCVYSGHTGMYDETYKHDCTDFYGKSKSLGEPTNCMNIRTSIIGEEKNHADSLIEWCKSMRGKEVNGYINHWWNGLTTTEYANVCSKIIKGNMYKTGTYHVFSSDITKYDMLVKISDKFGLDLKVREYMADESIDRRLRTIFDLNAELRIPDFDTMLRQM